MEWWTIVTVVASVIAATASASVALVIWLTQKQAREIHEKQLDHQVRLAEHQKNLDSARLVVELDKVYRTDGFRKAYRLMADGDIDLDNDEHKEWFLRYINHSEVVCKLFARGLISKSDMAVSYGGLEQLLNMNENTRIYIEKHRYRNMKWYFKYSRSVRHHQG